MVMKGKGYVDLLSSYGTLRITPLAVDLFRICFAKGQCRPVLFLSELPWFSASFRQQNLTLCI